MAAAIVVYIWIHNLAFNIPLLVYAAVRRLGVMMCAPFDAPADYILTTRLVNFYVPLIVTWASYIGIVYKFKTSANKAVQLTSIFTTQRYASALLAMTLCACVSLSVRLTQVGVLSKHVNG